MKNSDIGGLNIIVVEDDLDVAISMIEALECCGASVRHVLCSDEIPELLNFVKIDILVLDVGLPGEDGFSIAKRFRSSHPNAGIIIVSGLNETEDRARGYQSGADLFLTKPVHLSTLKTAIRNVSKRVQGAFSEDMLAVFDEAKNIISHSEKTVQITRRESLLLKRFLYANENFLNTSEIIDLLGLSLSARQKQNVELILSRFRKKMKKIDMDNVVIPIRENGYKLNINIKLLN